MGHQHLQLQQQHQQQQLQQQLDQAATGSVGGGTIPKVAGLRDTSINRPISKYVVQQHSVSNSFMDDSIDSIMGPMSSTKIDGGGHPISPAHNRHESSKSMDGGGGGNKSFMEIWRV